MKEDLNIYLFYLFILFIFTHKYNDINGVACNVFGFTVLLVTKPPPGYDWVVKLSPLWYPAPVSEGETFTF